MKNKSKFQTKGATRGYWKQRRRYLVQETRLYIIEQQRKEAQQRKEETAHG